MPIKTVPFDAAEYITMPDGQAELIADAIESGHAGYIAHAIGIVARARGMSSVAEAAGVTREGLYKSLAEDGDPKLSTVMGVLNALGIKLTAKAA